ncbi:MAG TPA: hypothetical protein VN840_22785 [Streptosporangiaceae bacterium]|nr:hypothetical protein [Streptosporangiaceae bacterium]
MQGIWVLVGAVAVVMMAIPLAAVALVSLASVREESRHSLYGQAPGPAERAARRLLAFHSESIGDLASGRRPAGRSASLGSAGRSDARQASPRSGHEVRFAYARRPLPDPGQRSARRQPQPGAIRLDQRQGAAV